MNITSDHPFPPQLMAALVRSTLDETKRLVKATAARITADNADGVGERVYGFRVEPTLDNLTDRQRGLVEAWLAKDGNSMGRLVEALMPMLDMDILDAAFGTGVDVGLTVFFNEEDFEGCAELVAEGDERGLSAEWILNTWLAGDDLSIMMTEGEWLHDWGCSPLDFIVPNMALVAELKASGHVMVPA